VITRDELIDSINQIIGKDLLEHAQKVDGNANGVQVHGKEEVTKLALGVSVSLDFLKEVADTGAQFIITHHGLPLSDKYTYNSRFSISQQAILKYVFDHNLTVAGYHHTLDAHEEIGNNAVIINKLGAKRLDEPYFQAWGWVGEFVKAIDIEKLADKCADVFDNDVFAVYAGPKKVKRIGVCSGGAMPAGADFHEIADKDIDLHLTGVITESGPYHAKAANFNYFAVGHYASEVFGVQELGKKLKDKFKDKLEVEFIDIPNPL
jgi:dinuclear metal center YbgI/SA1388 family protein